MGVSALRWRVGVLATHPIQYYAPWYRALSSLMDLEVYFSHRQTPAGQAAAGFGVAFDWDVPVLEGYRHTFLINRARRPGVDRFFGCDTPDIARIIAAEQFDAFIVHGWATWSYWQAILACWRTRTPVLVRSDSNLLTPRPGWWRLVKWPLFRTLLSRFDGYLIVGEASRRYLLHYGAEASRCFPAPHSVDNAFFAARADAIRPDRDRLREALGIRPDAVVFLFAGRLVDVKRPEVFVQALATAAVKSHAVTGLVVGDGPLREEAESHARRRGAPIRFTGFLNQTDMVSAYVVSDVLVLPSRSETWGLVVNEAMACGIPAIVTEGVGCVGDLLLPGRTGVVVPVDDSEALAAAIARLADDPSFRNQLSQNARAHVERFDVHESAKGTFQAVEALAAVRRAARGRTPGPARIPLR